MRPPLDCGYALRQSRLERQDRQSARVNPPPAIYCEYFTGGFRVIGRCVDAIERPSKIPVLPPRSELERRGVVSRRQTLADRLTRCLSGS
jgi:hypothetical protein